MNSEYSFPKQLKTLTMILMAVGIVAMAAGFFMDKSEHHGKFWANFLTDSFFFLSISVAATFFIALQYVSMAGWSIVLKRVFESVSMFVPVGAIALLIVLAMGTLHVHHLYHWMDPEVINPSSEHYDKVIAGKAPYLNNGFFMLRTLLYLGGWVLATYLLRKRSLEEDNLTGLANYNRSVKISAIFMVFFAVTSSTSAWDWIMSLDTHWYSTLFGWYIFSGMWISGIIVFILITLYLKKNGYLPNVNASHLHDLGKWMFAISFLWTYLWFAQFMLIWYSDIPEEVTYFIARLQDYKMIFFFTMLINFVFPMLLLMSKDAKRNTGFLAFVGVILLIGHWLDVFILIMPATVGSEWGIGFMEIGMFIGFLGLFVFTILKALSRAPLQVKNHPLLEESIHHHI